ncbi:MAG: nucleotidyl transferase AbiEii/AbiGii toxin family protein [Sedimenticola sp.]
MSTLLNIAGKIDPDTIAVFETVSQAMAELKMPYVVVGATARDLVLHYGHGAKIERATHDVDFAIEVPSWAAFDALKDKLCGRGFKTTKAQHRLISPAEDIVDIVPFGHIEDEQASIAWPPKGEVSMNVLGFQEACDTAEWVRINNEPELDIPVATPACMVLLKLIAWTDRAKDLRKKDAMDIAYLLSTYEVIQEVMEALYEADNTDVMDKYDWDVTQAAAHLLGQRAKSIAQTSTLQEIERLANGEIDRLMEEMCESVDAEYERNQQLMTAFISGFGIG